MAAGNWFPHNETALYMLNGTISPIDSTALTIVLGSIGSNLQNLAIMHRSSITGLIVAADGGNFGTTVQGGAYTTVNQSTVMFYATDVVITATSTMIRALYAAIISTTNSAIIAVSTLDTGGSELVVTDGGTLTIQFAATGVFRASVTQA